MKSPTISNIDGGDANADIDKDVCKDQRLMLIEERLVFMKKMIALKKVIAGIITSALAIGGFTATTLNSIMPESSIIVSAATVYAPSLNGNYIVGYCNSDGNVSVYTDSSLRTRGAAASKWGSASSYNAYISGSVDEIKIYSINGSVCYVGYPAGKSTKYGYIPTSAVTTFDGAANAVNAKGKVNTYKKSNLRDYYGYIANGDKVYVLGRSGSNYKVIYNIGGGNWKAGWINQSGYNSVIGYVVDNTTYTGYVNTSSQPLTLRNGAGTNYSQIALMSKGSSLTVLDGKRQTNGFYHVTYNGKMGYASAQYISFSKPIVVDNSSYTGYVNTSSQPLTLRNGAGTNYSQITLMPKGSSLTVLDGKKQTNGFYHVTYNGKTGYASAQYISFSKPNIVPNNQNIKTPTVYSQTDSRWGSYGYGYSNTAGTQKTNIYNAGCGLLSLTNAVYYLNCQFINPTTLADYSLKYGYRVNGVGTSGGLYKSFADNRGSTYGIAYNGSSSSYATLRAHLQAGEVAVGGAPGHLMAIVAYNSSNGKFLILDSYKSSNRDTYATGYTWKTENECRNINKLNFSSFYFIKRR